MRAISVRVKPRATLEAVTEVGPLPTCLRRSAAATPPRSGGAERPALIDTVHPHAMDLRVPGQPLDDVLYSAPLGVDERRLEGQTQRARE